VLKANTLQAWRPQYHETKYLHHSLSIRAVQLLQSIRYQSYSQLWISYRITNRYVPLLYPEVILMCYLLTYYPVDDGVATQGFFKTDLNLATVRFM